MLTVERRAITDEERSQIGQISQAQTRLGGCADTLGCIIGSSAIVALLVCIVYAVFGGISSLLSRSHPFSLPFRLFVWSIGIGAVAGVFLGLWLSLGGGSGDRRLRRLTRQDLSDGQIEVLHCVITEAVRLDGIEGDYYYFLDVGNGRLLFLYDRFSDEEDINTGMEEYQSLFPCRTFDVVLAPHSKQVLDVLCVGEQVPLPPSRIIDVEDEDLSDAYFPQDGEVITATLPTLIEDLKRLNKAQEKDKP